MSESTEGYAPHHRSGADRHRAHRAGRGAGCAHRTGRAGQRGEPAAAARRCVPGSPGHGTGRCNHRRPAPRAGSAEPSGRDAAGPPARATTCCHARTRDGTGSGEHAAAARPCRHRRPAPRAGSARPSGRDAAGPPAGGHHLLPRPDPGRYSRRARSRRSPLRRRTRQPPPHLLSLGPDTAGPVSRCPAIRPDSVEPAGATAAGQPDRARPRSRLAPAPRVPPRQRRVSRPPAHSPCRGEPPPRQPRCERRRGVRADRRRGHGARAPRRWHRAGRRPVGRRRTR